MHVRLLSAACTNARISRVAGYANMVCTRVVGTAQPHAYASYSASSAVVKSRRNARRSVTGDEHGVGVCDPGARPVFGLRLFQGRARQRQKGKQRQGRALLLCGCVGARGCLRLVGPGGVPGRRAHVLCCRYAQVSLVCVGGAPVWLNCVWVWCMHAIMHAWMQRCHRIWVHACTHTRMQGEMAHRTTKTHARTDTGALSSKTSDNEM